MSLNSRKNNPIKTNYIEAKIDNRHQNKNCRFCADVNEMVIHISKNSKRVKRSRKLGTTR